MMQLSLLDMVRVAKIVVPDLKAVAMVGDPLERQTFYRHFKEELPAVTSELQLIDLMNLPMAELNRRLLRFRITRPSSTPASITIARVYLTFRQSLVTQIAAWSNRPVVVNVSLLSQQRSHWGYIVQAEPIGQQAANLALRILSDESGVGHSTGQGRVATHLRMPALQRWGINEAFVAVGKRDPFSGPGTLGAISLADCSGLRGADHSGMSHLVGSSASTGAASAAEVQSRNAMHRTDAI